MTRNKKVGWCWCWCWYAADADMMLMLMLMLTPIIPDISHPRGRVSAAWETRQHWIVPDQCHHQHSLLRIFHFYRNRDELVCLERFLIWALGGKFSCFQEIGGAHIFKILCKISALRPAFSNKNILFHQKQRQACLFGKWGLRRCWSIDALSHNLVYLCISYWNDFLLWHLGRKFSSFQEIVLVYT